MNAFAKRLAKRRVQKMRRGVVALRISTTIGRNPRQRTTELEDADDLSDRRRPAIDLANIVDGHTPTITKDFTLIRDLAARFRIERRLAKHHRDAAVRQMSNCGDRRLDFDRIVADERSLEAARPRDNLPGAHVLDAIGRNAEP